MRGTLAILKLLHEAHEEKIYFENERTPMGLIDVLLPKILFKIDKNYLFAQQIGTINTLETRTHAHIDNKTMRIVAIGEDNISAQDLIIKDGFGHERVLIGDFDIAEQVLKYVIRKMMKNNIFIRPIAVVQIKRKLEGGITEVEKRAVVDSFESADKK